MIPTGSADPYSLRRQALGLVKIVLDDREYKECLGPLDIDLLDAIRKATEPVSAKDKINDLEKTGS